jgi:putative ABC transport system permease protein
LLIATAVTYQQTAFGMREALRSNTDPIVLLDGKCTESLRNEMRKAPGVLDTACAQGLPQLGSDLMSPINRRDAEPFGIRYLSVGFGFFELYGLKAVAGRFFSPEFGTDQSPPDNVWTAPESLVINEAAARQLGFASSADAVGETVTFMHVFRLPVTMAPRHDAKIIGVVEDFQMGPVRREITPAAFFVDAAQAQLLSIKLDGRSVPESLAAIDRISTEFGESGPPQRRFFEDSVQKMYVDLQRQGQLFSIFASVAVLIAVLGLIGLAAHAAVSRTKEIGIRKALGGHRWTIVGLLLWQFAKPVLLANLIAWPAAYYAMHIWLQGFARRVELEWWMFIAATLVTLVVALASVMVHSWMMAGVRPVEALRYE